jgi:hypothetical protein
MIPLYKKALMKYHSIEYIIAIKGKITGSCARILKGLKEV